MNRAFRLLAILLVLFGAAREVATGQEASGDRLAYLSAKYCTACHLPAPPDAVTREHWPQLFDLMRDWMRQRQLPFDEAEYTELLALFQKAGPESFPSVPETPGPGPLGFQRGDVGLECTEERPKITHLTVTDLDRDGRDDVLVSDDVTGQVTWLKIEEDSWKETVIAEIDSPASTTVVDYNRDGHPDIVVASLGFISPTDDPIGAVWLLVNRGDLTFEPVRLLHEVPRVTDVKPGDFNGDGKIDFVVAAFGWRETGEVILLEQVTPQVFLRHNVLKQNGAMQIEVTDFDRDGATDFLVLFAQQHESIEWFRNNGDGLFEHRTLARAPHPAFGSSSFQLVDLDGDGDLDLISTNGDMMDEVSLPKPYHGVRWLENRDGAFISRELATVPGCYDAVAHDMNGDGHLDLVVSSLYFDWMEADFPSLIWLENDGKTNFTAHSILDAPTNLARIDVGDLNHDGLPDIIVGGMHLPGPLGREARLTAVLATGRPPEKDPEDSAADTIKANPAAPASPPTSDPDRRGGD
jgi:hypothetical protein